MESQCQPLIYHFYYFISVVLENSTFNCLIGGCILLLPTTLFNTTISNMHVSMLFPKFIFFSFGFFSSFFLFLIMIFLLFLVVSFSFPRALQTLYICSFMLSDFLQINFFSFFSLLLIFFALILTPGPTMHNGSHSK